MSHATASLPNTKEGKVAVCQASLRTCHPGCAGLCCGCGTDLATGCGSCFGTVCRSRKQLVSHGKALRLLLGVGVKHSMRPAPHAAGLTSVRQVQDLAPQACWEQA